MKKIAFIALAALAGTALTGCDEFTLPNPPAQSNTEEPLFVASSLQVTDLAGGKIDLPAANGEVELLSYAAENVPEGRHIKFVMEMSLTEDFAKTAEVALTSGEDNVARISATDLQMAYAAALTREPAQRSVYVRYAAYITNAAGNENVRIGGSDQWYANSQINFTPVLLGHEIEDFYYLIGSFNNWELSTAIPFQKSKPGNQYDEPDFYLAVGVSVEQAQAGYSWKIVPGSAVESGTAALTYGAAPANPAEPLAGALVEAGPGAENAGVVPLPGAYMIKINMYDLTYTVDLAYEQLYVNARGYYPTFNKMLRLFTSDYVNYGGVVYTSGTFRLYCQAGSGTLYGEATGSQAVTEDGVTSGKLEAYAAETPENGLNVPEKSLYYVKANLKDLVWSAAIINSISLVGEFNGWNTADEAATMTPNNYSNKYTINDVEMPAGEFKFCCNHAWTLSFGGALDNIVENGGNIRLDEAGTYDIVLDFTTIPYSVKVTKK